MRLKYFNVSYNILLVTIVHIKVNMRSVAGAAVFVKFVFVILYFVNTTLLYLGNNSINI